MFQVPGSGLLPVRMHGRDAVGWIFRQGVIDSGRIEYGPGLLRKRAGERSGRCRACLRYMLRICNKGWHRVRAYAGYNPSSAPYSLFSAFSLPSRHQLRRRGLRRRPGKRRPSIRRDCHSSRELSISGSRQTRSPDTPLPLTTTASFTSLASADVLPLLLSPRRPRRARWLIAQTSPLIPRCPSPLSPRHSAPLL